MTEQHKDPSVEEAVKCIGRFGSRGDHAEYARAFSVLSKALPEDENNLAVRSAVAFCYAQGVGGAEINKTFAAFLAEPCRNAGPEGALGKFVLAYLSDDNDEKLRLYEQAAKDGSAIAQYEMGQIHENNGEATPAEISCWKMKEFYEMAAAQEHPNAMVEQVLNDLGLYDDLLEKERGKLPDLNLSRAYDIGKKVIDLSVWNVAGTMEIWLEQMNADGLGNRQSFNALAKGTERTLQQDLVKFRLMEYFIQKKLEKIQADHDLNNGAPGAPAPGNDI